MTKRIDLTNKYFGRLLVIERDLSKTSRVYWHCRCLCDSELISVSSVNLISGKTKSCGCLRKEINHHKNNDDKATALRLLYRRYKTDAKVRNKEFKLTTIEFENLVIQNCSYCNDPPSKQVQRKNKKDKFRVYSFKYNGIDRKINNLGYLSNNCVSCCTICNRAKDVLSEEEFLLWIRKVNNHRNNNG